jgi:predicted enzyme related to lactoylglutathione lyase
MEDWVRPVVSFEIQGRDSARLQDFYRQMFNWDIVAGPGGVARAAGGIGGPEPGPLSLFTQGDTPSVRIYVQVRDLRTSIDKAIALGGSARVQPFDVPGGPTIAQIIDPEGNVVGLVQQ